MNLTTNYVLSQVFVIIGYVLLITTYQMKNRKSILVTNFISLLSLCISYVFLSAYSGLVITIIALIRNVVFLSDEDEKITKKDVIVLITFFIISIIAAIFTYDGILSLMPLFATLLYTYSVWQNNTKLYKILGIIIEIIWMIYNIYIFSVFGIVFELALTLSAIIGVIRESTNNKN